jgi:hypothetical protein
MSSDESDVTSVISFLLNKFPQTETKKIERFESTEGSSDNKNFFLSKKQILIMLLILLILLVVFLFVKFFLLRKNKIEFYVKR